MVMVAGVVAEFFCPTFITRCSSQRAETLRQSARMTVPGCQSASARVRTTYRGRRGP